MKTLLSLFLAFVIFVGCDGSYENTPEQSDTAFSVTLAPAFASTAATQIPVNSQLILHASSALDPSSVNENTVYIQNSFQELQAAYVTLIGQEIIIQPKIYLTANMDFEIIVTTALTDTEGRRLTQTVVIPFSSALSSPDTTPPTLVDRLAKDKGTIEPQTILYYQFNESISPLNINNSMITISNSTSGHSIQATARVSGTLLIFTPNEPFIPSGNTYTITLDLNQTITDLAGNVLVQGDQVDSLSISSGLATIKKPLQQNYYSSNSQVHCIESTEGDTVVQLYVGGTNGLEIIDFNLFTHSFSKRSQISPDVIGAVYSIEIDSTSKRLYLGSSEGFNIIDITDITRPLHLSTYPTTFPVYGTHVIGEHAYLASTIDGVIDLNISIETAPAHIFTNNISNGIAFDVVIHDNRIVIADYDKGVTTYALTGNGDGSYPDTLNPGQTRSLIKHPDAGSYQDTFLIASGIAGFKAFEVSANTVYAGYLPSPAYVRKVVAKDSFIYYNVENIGIAKIEQAGYASYNQLGYLIPEPFIDAVTFTQVNDTSGLNKHLILVDNNGRLYSMVL